MLTVNCRLVPGQFRPNQKSFRTDSTSFRPNSKAFRPDQESFAPTKRVSLPEVFSYVLESNKGLT